MIELHVNGKYVSTLSLFPDISGGINDLVAALEIKRKQHSKGDVREFIEFKQPRVEVSLPLFTSKVAAGFPSPAEDHVEKRIQPNSFLIENENATFCLRVKGDSMIEAGIFDNDVLIVDRSRNAQIGDIILAVLDGDFTVKTLGRTNTGPCLIPANKNYSVIPIKEGQHFEIWGVVTGSMRKFK